MWTRSPLGFARRYGVKKTALLLSCVALVLIYAFDYKYWNWVAERSYNDFWAYPNSMYKWPLDIDTEKVMTEYKAGVLSLEPITVDPYNIIVRPPESFCQGDRSLVTVLIKTRVEDKYNRDLLRQTWVADLAQNSLRHVFLVGLCAEQPGCNASLRAEMDKHKDVMQGDFIDSYLNNTHKFRQGLKYMTECDNSQYVFFLDGDYALNVHALVEFLRVNGTSHMFTGKLWPASYPPRRKADPHYMSFEFYPFRRLPPFIAAGATILSRDIVLPLHVVARYTKYVPFDDVFYGMVAAKLLIDLKDLSDLIPSWFIPKLRDIASHRRMIGSHRFGNLTEVKLIHQMLHS